MARRAKKTMRIDSLVKALGLIREKYGNAPVYILTDILEPIEKAYFSEDAPDPDSPKGGGVLLY